MEFSCAAESPPRSHHSDCVPLSTGDSLRRQLQRFVMAPRFTNANGRGAFLYGGLLILHVAQAFKVSVLCPHGCLVQSCRCQHDAIRPSTAYAHQEFPVAGRLGGPISFLCMRPAGTEERASRDFRGREDCHDIGILIEVREKDFSIDISATMERAAYRALNFVDNWRARDSTEGFVIGWADTAPFSVEKAEEALRAGIRMQFPALQDFDISIIRDKEHLATLLRLLRASSGNARPPSIP